VVKQEFVIEKYYHWDRTEDKEVKIQTDEFYKILKGIKVENIFLHDEFLSELMIGKLVQSWINYHQ